MSLETIKSKLPEMKTRRGQMGVGDLGPLATTLLVIVVTVAVGAVMLAQFGDVSAVNNSSTATSVIDQGQQALQTFGDFLPVIVIVGIGAVILALMRVFGGGRGGRVSA
jgi:hypothetical protein